MAGVPTNGSVFDADGVPFYHLKPFMPGQLADHANWMKMIDDAGIKIKSGLFSKEENAVILRNWHLVTKGKTLAEKRELLSSSGSVIKGKKLYTVLARDLNDRTGLSVFGRLQRMSKIALEEIVTEENNNNGTAPDHNEVGRPGAAKPNDVGPQQRQPLREQAQPQQEQAQPVAPPVPVAAAEPPEPMDVVADVTDMEEVSAERLQVMEDEFVRVAELESLRDVRHAHRNEQMTSDAARVPTPQITAQSSSNNINNNSSNHNHNNNNNNNNNNNSTVVRPGIPLPTFQDAPESAQTVASCSIDPVQQQRDELMAVMKHLPVFKYSGAGCSNQTSEYDECVICMMDYDEGDELMMLACWHKLVWYHQACITKWVTKKQALCPLCNTSVVKAYNQTVGICD